MLTLTDSITPPGRGLSRETEPGTFCIYSMNCTTEVEIPPSSQTGELGLIGRGQTARSKDTWAAQSPEWV